jgi:hypothetical protein
VLRVSYARVLETPFNENLVLASNGCNNVVLNPLLGCFAQGQVTPLSPGWRNEFHAGIQQAFGRYVVFSGEYIWKYTHDGYDFSILGNTRLRFRWNGSGPRFQDMQGASACRIFTDSPRWQYFPGWLRGSLRRRWAELALCLQLCWRRDRFPSGLITTKNSI